MTFKLWFTLARHLIPRTRSLVQHKYFVFYQNTRFNSTFNAEKKCEDLSRIDVQRVVPKQIKDLHERYLFVRTCVEFWEDLPAGVAFDTAYLDTHPDAVTSQDVPVVVALHDSPGTANDLIPILQPFCNIGYRVIAVNFPGKMSCMTFNSVNRNAVF